MQRRQKNAHITFVKINVNSFLLPLTIRTNQAAQTQGDVGSTQNIQSNRLLGFSTLVFRKKILIYPSFAKQSFARKVWPVKLCSLALQTFVCVFVLASIGQSRPLSHERGSKMVVETFFLKAFATSGCQCRQFN